MKFFIKSTGAFIELEEKPFASGGEGALYKIIKSDKWGHFVAKIFHKNKLDHQKQQKITYLLITLQKEVSDFIDIIN